MVRKLVLVEYEIRIQSIPFIFLNLVPTWDASKFYHSQVEHPHRNRLELKIPFLATMVYVSYCLFSSYGILTSIREVLRSLGSGM